MREDLQRICEDFVQNRDVVKHAFKMESTYVYPICANIFCARGMVVPEERLEECRKMLKEKTGIFSSFRGIVRAPITSMLAAGSSPDSRMDRALENHALLKEKFWGSEYLALVAFLMADMTSGPRAAERVARGRGIYERMKKEHPFLTAGEDSIFAVLMAFSEKTDDQLIADMEECYTLLRKRFSDGNAAQSASHVLALTQGTPAEKVERMLALYNGLEAAGRKYGRHRELATLAAMVGLDAETSALVDDMLEADRFLAEQKGYGALGMDKRTRLMHAAMLVSDLYTPRDYVDTAAMAGTIAIIAAQQAALCTMIICASASSSAAAGSSH